VHRKNLNYSEVYGFHDGLDDCHVRGVYDGLDDYNAHCHNCDVHGVYDSFVDREFCGVHDGINYKDVYDRLDDCDIFFVVGKNLWKFYSPSTLGLKALKVVHKVTLKFSFDFLGNK
jgi:hypothetical protein